MERLKLVSEESSVVQSNDMEVDALSSEQDKTSRRDGDAKSFTGGPSSWYGLILPKLLCLAMIIYLQF